MSWIIATPAVGAAFSASVVEVVEAFTIVLAAAALRGWRPAVLGMLAALGVLGLLILVLGPLVDRLPLRSIQLFVGVLLLIFGMGWLRKAILRSAGILALHDENAAFEAETGRLARDTASAKSSAEWIAGLVAFKGVLLEGLEVVFIVVAVGAGRGLIWQAAAGASAACVAVLVVGAIIHRPLAAVPENTLKFCVGVMLCSFGVFWSGEGLGVAWPGDDIALFAFVLLFLLIGVATATLLRQQSLRPLS